MRINSFLPLTHNTLNTIILISILNHLYSELLQTIQLKPLQQKMSDPTSAIVPISPSTPKTPLRRPRGRPAGLKNKPKPPIIIAHESPGTLRTHAIEIASGCDISGCIAAFARKRLCGVCILSGSGCVANVTLQHPSTAAAVVKLCGCFEILSLVGSFLPAGAIGGVTVFLAGAQGQVVGGSVVGPLLAVGPVVVMAGLFAGASFERLPEERLVAAGGIVGGWPEVMMERAEGLNV